MGVRAVGDSLSEAYEQGALAMTALVTDPAGIEARARVTIECSAPDQESIGGRAAGLIIEQAKQWPADVIVMGTHETSP